MKAIKTVALFAWSEINLASGYGVQTNIDTLRRWIGVVAFCAGIYFLIYFYEDFWLWLSEVTSYSYVPTSAGKVKLHRFAFGALCIFGVTSATFQYAIHLTRRIRAFRAARSDAVSQMPPT